MEKKINKVTGNVTSKNENHTYNYFGMEWVESKKKPNEGYKGKLRNYTYTSKAGTLMVRKKKDGLKNIGNTLKILIERYRETGRPQTIAITRLMYTVSFKQGRFWREHVKNNITVADIFGDMLSVKEVRAYGYDWSLYMAKNGKYCIECVAGKILFNRYEIFTNFKKQIRKAVRYYRHTGEQLQLEESHGNRKYEWAY